MSWRVFTGVFGQPPQDRDFQRSYAGESRAPTQYRLRLRTFSAFSISGEATEPGKLTHPDRAIVPEAKIVRKEDCETQ